MAWTSDKKPRSMPLRTSMIRPPDTAFYQTCDENKLQGLMKSIARFGVINPVIVTREPLELWYTIVAGRRRVAAAKRLGIDSLPAITVPPEQAAYYTILENLHRTSPNSFETAQLLSETLQSTGESMESFSEGLGLGEGELEQKLRLLALGPEAVELCRAAGVPQEMGNRILKLPKSERDKLFFGLLNPAKEIGERVFQLRDRLGLNQSDAPQRTMVVKDVRLFFNTIDRAVDVMKQSGIGVSAERHDYDGFIEYLVRIPNRAPEPAPAANSAG